jgi:hypothetical protein
MDGIVTDPMTLEERHARINEISDLCNTTIVYDSMSREDVVSLLYGTLSKIYELLVTYDDLADHD